MNLLRDSLAKFRVLARFRQLQRASPLLRANQREDQAILVAERDVSVVRVLRGRRVHVALYVLAQLDATRIQIVGVKLLLEK